MLAQGLLSLLLKGTTVLCVVNLLCILVKFPHDPLCPPLVEIYWESEWTSEASGITSSSKVRKRANNLYCLITLREKIKGKKKRRKTKRRRET